ncbi:MAG: NAD(P)H-dependent oxidoreductase [Pararhodobacter sp.]|nr:NAD(P)H-dependent oxidoreductase [Pararhodobacter sp.]
MNDLKLLGLCGSLRRASLNRKLMVEGARAFGGVFEEGGLHLPLFDGDLEAEGLPEAVTRLAEQMASADAVLIACPEYNKAPPGLLKNALDWVSRVKGQPLEGRPVAIVSATAGRAGGERTQSVLRHMLQPFRAHVLPFPEVLVGHAAEQFDSDDRLINERNAKALEGLMARLREQALARRAALKAA